jgi:shikimate kinase
MSGRVPRQRAVILVGFMGAGKSSVGRALAQRMGWTFEDLDERVELGAGKSVAEIFRECGEAEFRRLERAALNGLLDEVRGGSEKVIALGGGAFVQEACAEMIGAAGLPTVFLDAKVEELWERCTRQAESQGWQRPLLEDEKRFRELYEERRPHYLKAELRHETGGKGVEEIAAELVVRLDLPVE